MTPPPDVTALLLVGGKSQRFGTPKAFFPVDGVPMAQRVHEAVEALGIPVAASVQTGIAHPLADTVTAISDAHIGIGPLGGLHAGLCACTTPWLLVVACDLPWLDPATLRTLLAARTDTLDAVVASDSSGWDHPLCACYARHILPIIEAQIAAASYAMHALLNQLANVRTVRVPDYAVRNINTPADLGLMTYSNTRP